MSVKLNDSFTREFVKESELEYIAPQAEVALSLLKSKKGLDPILLAGLTFRFLMTVMNMPV